MGAMYVPDVGQLIPEGAEALRDAIHLAVAPVEAGEDMRAGAKVILINGKAFPVRRGEQAVGVVERSPPWFRASPGRSSMLAILFRNKQDQDQAAGFISAINAEPYDQTTRLIFADWLEERGYDDEAAVQPRWTAAGYRQAVDRLNNFAQDDCEIPLEELLDSMAEGELHLGISSPDLPDELWQDFMLVTGRPVPEDEWSNFFISCSC